MAAKKATKKAPVKTGAVAPIHPATVRVDKCNDDGTVSPFSLEEQWKQIEDWHRFLEDEEASNYPVLDGFNEAWEELDSQYAINGKSIIERGADLRRVSGTPISAFFYFVDMGFYPPPELMLALHDCWETYMANMGTMSLEEAFIGKPKKGAGNYASRKGSSFKRMKMQWDFADFMGQGLSRSQAAEALSQLLGGKPDADSILRMFRGVKPMKITRRKEAEK